jgi:hypothetical protein
MSEHGAISLNFMIGYAMRGFPLMQYKTPGSVLPGV